MNTPACSTMPATTRVPEPPVPPTISGGGAAFSEGRAVHHSHSAFARQTTSRGNARIDRPRALVITETVATPEEIANVPRKSGGSFERPIGRQRAGRLPAWDDRQRAYGPPPEGEFAGRVPTDPAQAEAPMMILRGRSDSDRRRGVVQSDAVLELLTFYAFPKETWKSIRTTNTIENLDREFRRIGSRLSGVRSRLGRTHLRLLRE